MTLIYLIYLLQLTILNERLSQGPAVLSSVDVFIPFVREFFIYLRSCLKVVLKLSVPEYILTFQTGSTAFVLPQYCLLYTSDAADE